MLKESITDNILNDNYANISVTSMFSWPDVYDNRCRTYIIKGVTGWHIENTHCAGLKFAQFIDFNDVALN
jgi:hypothetical protein